MSQKKTVPFSKIKKGEFFRLKGEKTLYQRGCGRFADMAQCVTGRNCGKAINKSITPVVPVNAKIVEKE